MSTTDPLREALSTLIEEIAGPVGRIRLEAITAAAGVDIVHRDADLIAAAMTRAREALAAVPAARLDAGTVAAVGDALRRDDEAMWRAADAFMASTLDTFDDEDRESIRDRIEEAVAAAFGVSYHEPQRPPSMTLAAVPAEPEAWEWRARVRVEDFDDAPDFSSSVPYDTPERPAQIVAEDRAEGRTAWIERRRAPGEWERVDPEPRPQDGGER